MPSTYKRDKPWDTDDIDKWKIDKFTEEDNKGGTFVEESSFATLLVALLFPVFYANIFVQFPEIPRTVSEDFMASYHQKLGQIRYRMYTRSCGGFYDCEDNAKKYGY